MITTYTKELCKKYAQAFLNVYKKTITEDIILAITQLSWQLSNAQILLTRLNSNFYSAETKKNILKLILIEHYQLPLAFENLINLLIKDKNFIYINEVLKALIQLYHKEHNITFFTFTSSHELNKNQLTDLQKFIEHQIHKKIHYVHHVDPSLIAGIKLQSDALIWEYSIHKQLKTLNGIIHQ